MRGLILSLAIFFMASLNATLEWDHPLTLGELVNIALENTPATKQAWWNATRAAAFLGVAKSAYYPQIDLEATAQNGRDFKFINGPDTSYTIFGADAILSLMLYDFGLTQAKVNMAKMSLLAANWQNDWTIQKVLVGVLENAYSTLHAQEVLNAAFISLQDAETILNTAKSLNQAGLSPISDVYTSLALYSQTKMDVIQQKALLDIQIGKLAASIGVDPTTKITLAHLDELILYENYAVDELIALGLKQRGDLMAKQARISESLANKQRAKALYAPKVSLYGRGGANHAVNDKANAAQYRILLNVDFPLFDGFQTLYENKLAYADTQISLEAFAELQLNIALEILTYSRSLEAAKEMLIEAKTNLENSEKAYEGTLERYKSGKDRIIDLSYAQKILALARTKYSDIKTRGLVSLANLSYATGTLAPYMDEK